MARQAALSGGEEPRRAKGSVAPEHRHLSRETNRSCADIPADPNDVAIVEAFCALGLSLGLRITAEGIETREQLAVLRRLGCHEGQGYLFSRPLPAEALSRLAGEGRACAGFESGLAAVARMER